MPEPTEPKTIQEWILTIQDHLTRRKILKLAIQDSLADTVPTLYDALSGAFDWSESKEGYSYWANIADDLCHVAIEEPGRAEFDPDHFNHE